MRLRIDAVDVQRFGWEEKRQRDSWFDQMTRKPFEMTRKPFELELLYDDPPSNRLLYGDVSFPERSDGEEFRQKLKDKYNVDASEVPEDQM